MVIMKEMSISESESAQKGPQILTSEVEHAMKRIKKGKAPGPDSINIEYNNSCPGDVKIQASTSISNCWKHWKSWGRSNHQDS